MKKIVLARVDDRLIHTEILTLWVPEVRANRILIVDDIVAKDKFRSKVIKEMVLSFTFMELTVQLKS